MSYLGQIVLLDHSKEKSVSDGSCMDIDLFNSGNKQRHSFLYVVPLVPVESFFRNLS